MGSQRAGQNLATEQQQNGIAHYTEYLLLLPIWLKSQLTFVEYLVWCKHLQFSSVAQSCPTLCDPMDCTTPGFPVQHQLLEFTQTHVHQVCDAIQPSHPLWSLSPPAFNLSQHEGLFKCVSYSHQMAKVLEFQLHHSPFNENSGLISFKMDCLDLLPVQGTLKNLLEHHSSKASILQHSAFFMEKPLEKP